MTKVLFVLRHAQSAGKQSAQLDYDRSLTPEGEKKAIALGQKLKGDGHQVEFILSSGATRARQTVDAVNKFLQMKEEKIQFRAELYDAMMLHWVDHIHALPDHLTHVMVVGHNPWLSMVASSFSKSVIDLNPGELIAFEFNVDSWKQIDSLAEKILRVNPEK